MVLDGVAPADPDLDSAYPQADHPTIVAPPNGRRAATVTRLGAAAEAVVGIWLAISPWVVGSGGSSVLRWNDLAVGAGLALMALPRLVKPAMPRTPVVSFGLGAWTIVAAFVLSFQNGSTGTAPLWNAIAVRSGTDRSRRLEHHRVGAGGAAQDLTRTIEGDVQPAAIVHVVRHPPGPAAGPPRTFSRTRRCRRDACRQHGTGRHRWRSSADRFRTRLPDLAALP